MKPTIGRIVHYTLSAQDAEQINKRRKDAQQSGSALRNDGSQIHFGNNVSDGETYPMIITRVWSDTAVNGSVLLDGNDTFWATSVSEGEGPRHYAWPERV